MLTKSKQVLLVSLQLVNIKVKLVGHVKQTSLSQLEQCFKEDSIASSYMPIVEEKLKMVATNKLCIGGAQTRDNTSHYNNAIKLNEFKYKLLGSHMNMIRFTSTVNEFYVGYIKILI